MNSPLFFYNTLHRQKELFMPIEPGVVRMYSCGPTVYGPAHIGNLRAYIFTDVLKRVIQAAGLSVQHAMNITDVGHLVGDGDEGEDKLEVGAKAEGTHPLTVAKKYEALFWDDFEAVGCQKPDTVIRATEAIESQLELIKNLESKGFVYKTDQALYFDTSRLADYGKLTGQRLDDKQVGVRDDVVVDAQKKHPTDFALWFFLFGRYQEHILHWTSPWGEGFPGWHLECSAISRQALGQPFDIHTGGVEHIGTHHTNEIAQSEAAYGQPLAHVWMHNEHLLVDGKKMSKSLGNLVILADMLEKGFDPLDFRYLCLMAQYRSRMNFTWEALAAARRTREGIVALLESKDAGEEVDAAPYQKILYDDLDTPRFLAMLHEAKNPALWRRFDSVLGLGLQAISVLKEDKLDDFPDIARLFLSYKIARKNKDYETSDLLRHQLLQQGWTIRDEVDDSFIRRVSDSPF